MATILTIDSNTTRVTANAVIGEFAYKVDYEYDSAKALIKFTCIVWDKNLTKMSGSVSLIGGNKTVNLPDDDSFDTHVTNINNIIAEVKTSLS